MGILCAALRRRSSYSRQRPTLPRRFQRSTIGAEGLNFRVRDGNGCDPLATITQKLALPVARSACGSCNYKPPTTSHKPLQLKRRANRSRQSHGLPGLLLRVNLMVKPNGQLVAVSFIHYWTSTSALSSRSSSCALLNPRGFGRSHLGMGFVLICVQRLSRLNFATQRCHWRDSWNTRGRSVPVLSYWGQVPSNLLRPHQIGTELSRDVLNPAHVPL